MHIDPRKLEARLGRLLDPKMAREIIETSLFDPGEAELEGELLATNMETTEVEPDKVAKVRVKIEDNRLTIAIGRQDGHLGGVVFGMEVAFDPEGRVRSPFGEIDVFALEPLYGVMRGRMQVGPDRIRVTLDEAKAEQMDSTPSLRAGGTSLLGPAGFIDNTMTGIEDLDIVEPIARGKTSGLTWDRKKKYDLICAEKPTRHERQQIARLIALGFRSGYQPGWELIMTTPLATPANADGATP